MIDTRALFLLRKDVAEGAVGAADARVRPPRSEFCAAPVTSAPCPWLASWFAGPHPDWINGAVVAVAQLLPLWTTQKSR